MKEKKIVRSFAELTNLFPKEKEETIVKEKVEKVKKEQPKKEKALYEGNNIIRRGTQLATTDRMYETYSQGSFTSWRITVIGEKNGAIDIGNSIEDGYAHSSFHDRNRAAAILVEMINRNKEN